MITAVDQLALNYSPLDSARFGRRIFRGTCAAIEPLAFIELLRQEKVDTLILRMQAEQICDVEKLYDVGLRPIVADVQVHYKIALSEYRAREIRPAISLVPVGSIDRSRLRQLAQAIFRDYASHYSANPLFASSQIAEGYADWATRLLDREGAVIWFVHSESETVGFAGCEDESSNMRGVLNGIVPHARRKGFYNAMLHSMLQFAIKSGRQSFTITTQVHNVAVQRAWANAGLKLIGADATIHINCGFNSISDENFSSCAA